MGLEGNGRNVCEAMLNCWIDVKYHKLMVMN